MALPIVVETRTLLVGGRSPDRIANGSAGGVAPASLIEVGHLPRSGQLHGDPTSDREHSATGGSPCGWALPGAAAVGGGRRRASGHARWRLGGRALPVDGRRRWRLGCWAGSRLCSGLGLLLFSRLVEGAFQIANPRLNVRLVARAGQLV